MVSEYSISIFTGPHWSHAWSYARSLICRHSLWKGCSKPPQVGHHELKFFKNSAFQPDPNRTRARNSIKDFSVAPSQFNLCPDIIWLIFKLLLSMICHFGIKYGIKFISIFFWNAIAYCYCWQSQAKMLQKHKIIGKPNLDVKWVK